MHDVAACVFAAYVYGFADENEPEDLEAELEPETVQPQQDVEELLAEDGAFSVTLHEINPDGTEIFRKWRRRKRTKRRFHIPFRKIPAFRSSSKCLRSRSVRIRRWRCSAIHSMKMLKRLCMICRRR